MKEGCLEEQLELERQIREVIPPWLLQGIWHGLHGLKKALEVKTP